MVIIKENFIASYTKFLVYLFEGITARDGALFKTHYKLKAIERFKRGMKYDKDYIHYFSALEDVPTLGPKPLEELLKFSPEVPWVLHVIPPWRERVMSIVLRDFNADLFTLDEMINRIQERHTKRVDTIFTVEHNKKNTSNTILMDNFEELCALHKQGKINLLVITKDTIINAPQKIFDYLQIDSKVEAGDHSNRRELQGNSPERIELAVNIINDISTEVDTRYAKIHSIIERDRIPMV